jgi:Flagellar biosynthesis pathway, component FlhB
VALKKEAIRIRAFNLQFFSSEKTEPATPRKREQSREEGQSAKSQDLTAALIMITGLVCFLWFGATMWDAMVGLFDDSIRHLSSDVFQGDRWLDGLIQKAGVVFLSAGFRWGLYALLLQEESWFIRWVS